MVTFIRLSNEIVSLEVLGRRSETYYDTNFQYKCWNFKPFKLNLCMTFYTGYPWLYIFVLEEIWVLHFLISSQNQLIFFVLPNKVFKSRFCSSKLVIWIHKFEFHSFIFFHLLHCAFKVHFYKLPSSTLQHAGQNDFRSPKRFRKLQRQEGVVKSVRMLAVLR